MYFAKVLVTASALFSVASAATYNITVGPGLTFQPSSVSNAVAGDIILFLFNSSTSHTATESTFDSPCTPKPSGFDSSPLTSASPRSDYSVTLNATTPVWVYCRVGSHCKSGMVFAVNPTGSQTLDAFKAKAAGGSVPSGSSTSTSSVSPTPAGPSSGGGYGGTGSGAKTSVQKLTAGLAGVAFLAKLLL